MLPGEVGSTVEEDEDGKIAPAAIVRRGPRRSVVSEETLREGGIPFARTVRMCGLDRGEASVFVDSHNEIWKLGEDAVVPLSTPPRLVTALATSQKGHLVGLADGTVNRFDGDGELAVIYGRRGSRPVSALAVSADAEQILAATVDDQLLLGRADSTELRWTSSNVDDTVGALAVSSCGSTVAAATGTGTVRLLETDCLEETRARIIVEAGVVEMAFSEDARLLALLLDDGRLPVFRVDDHRRVFELRFDEPRPMSVSFTGDDILHGLVAHAGRIGCLQLTH